MVKKIFDLYFSNKISGYFETIILKFAFIPEIQVLINTTRTCFRMIVHESNFSFNCTSISLSIYILVMLVFTAQTNIYFILF